MRQSDSSVSTEDRPEPLTAHLQELRRRFIRVVIAFVIGFILGWMPAPSSNTNLFRAIFLSEYKPIAALIFQDLIVKALPEKVKIVTLGLLTPLEVIFNICVVLGLLLAIPVLCIELYQFVKRGLYRHERNIFRAYFSSSVVLFFVGLAFGYIIIFHALIRLYLILTPMLGLSMLILARTIMNELMGAMIFSAIIFETPVIMTILTHLEVAKPQSYAEYRPIVYAIVMILVCIFNPDPTLLSSLIWIGTFIMLYEVGIIVSKKVYKKYVEKRYRELEGSASE